MPFESTAVFGDLFDIPLRNGLTKPKAVRGSGTRMVNMGELFANSRLVNTPMERVPTTESEFEKNKLEPGDLLFARQSLILSGAGKCSIFLEDEEDVVFESHLIRCRLNRQKADPYFYYSYFSSWQGRSNIESITEQVAVAGIRGSDLAKIEVIYPPLEDQQAISGILATIDDKIELNRKTNETFEGIAKALFKSWFMDFGPVRAKAAGRPTGLPDEISELFPDSFKESELGEIPRGWSAHEIGNVVDCVGGSTPSTTDPDFWDQGNNFWATPKDLSDLHQPFLLETTKKITDKGVEKISSGILPAGTVLLSSRAPVGYVAVTTFPVSINQGFIAMKPSDSMPTNYLLNWTLSNIQKFKDRASGTTFPEISKSSFRPIKILIPNREPLDYFDRQVDPIYQKVVINIKESKTLSDLRDSILPKLISGELLVPDAERMLEEVGI